jgi:mono/diheme cytochrome c family protein
MQAPRIEEHAMDTVIILVALIAVAILLVLSCCRARRIDNRLLKWSAMALAGILAVAISSVSAMTTAGIVKQHGRHAPVPDITVDITPDRVARGKSISDSFCSGCHSKTGNMTGGREIGDEFPIPVGSFTSSNLTPAGALKHWSDGEIFRAIRNGVGADGRWLTVMSYVNSGRLSDDDTLAVIAYLRSLPCGGKPTPEPPDRLNLLGTAMLGAGMLPAGKPVFNGRISAPPKSPTAEYGEYILSYQDCRECHGERLTGGVQGQLAPIGPGLGMVSAWKLPEFIATMRTGVDPTGRQIDKQMPWEPIGRMDDQELAAVYEYLRQLPEM